MLLSNSYVLEENNSTILDSIFGNDVVIVGDGENVVVDGVGNFEEYFGTFGLLIL